MDAASTSTPLVALAPSVISNLYLLGIPDYEALCSYGSVVAFLLLKQAGFNANYKTLYSLEAAVRGIHWSQLSDFERINLREKANKHVPVRLPPPIEQIAQFMDAAQQLADFAAKQNEVPVGCVVVRDGKIIGQGFNRLLTDNDPSAHAEIVALRDAAKNIGNYRLNGCDLYVTLEPCLMCAGAIMQARIERLLFGAAEPKTGAAGSVINLFSNWQLNKHTALFSEINAASCAEKLQSFFLQRRQR